MRDYEVDGKDYNFITKEEFEQMLAEGSFAEYAVYRGWYYGTALTSCADDMSVVAVLTPSGMRNIKKAGFDVVSVYLQVDRVSRLINILNRGDNPDEAYRRNVSDEGMFANFESEADITINNDKYTLDKDEVFNKTIEKIKKFLKERKNA